MKWLREPADPELASTVAGWLLAVMLLQVLVICLVKYG